jgi:coenzyme F420-dependent glucose-6-phosphate dehydrogenase
VALAIGYKASAEQFAPRELLDFAVRCDELGFGHLSDICVT